MVLATCLLKTIDHNSLPQKIFIQEGTNLLQRMQVIGMEMEHNAILGQKIVGEFVAKTRMPKVLIVPPFTKVRH
jgi:hypothetical protein